MGKTAVFSIEILYSLWKNCCVPYRNNVFFIVNCCVPYDNAKNPIIICVPYENNSVFLMETMCSLC